MVITVTPLKTFKCVRGVIAWELVAIFLASFRQASSERLASHKVVSWATDPQHQRQRIGHASITYISEEDTRDCQNKKELRQTTRLAVRHRDTAFIYKFNLCFS